MAQLYINLPVADLPKATAFYEALGFTKNTDFSNEDASAMIYDDTLSVMLLTRGFFQGFLGTKTISHSLISTEVLNALQLDSRDAVDAFFEQVLVNCDDARLRANRYAVLARLRAAFLGVADVSLLAVSA